MKTRQPCWDTKELLLHSLYSSHNRVYSLTYYWERWGELDLYDLVKQVSVECLNMNVHTGENWLWKGFKTSSLSWYWKGRWKTSVQQRFFPRIWTGVERQGLRIEQMTGKIRKNYDEWLWMYAGVDNKGQVITARFSGKIWTRVWKVSSEEHL